MRLAIYACLALVWALPSHSVTQISEIKAAEPVKRVPPQYPKNSAFKGKEGWVKVSFVVDTQGKVIDPIVTDSSGIKDFEKAALKAISKWTYSPALENGEPVQQCETLVQLDFKLSKPQMGVTRKFMRYYRKASKAIEDKDYPTAEEQLTLLKNRRIGNMYEDAWYSMLHADLMSATGQTKQELQSLRRATFSNRREYLGDSNFLLSLHRRFIAEVKLGYWQNALTTFERIRDLPNSQGSVAQLGGYAKQVQDLLDSDESLGFSAVISDSGTWSHRLTRGHFGLDNIKGDLDNLDIRCRHRRNIYTVDDESTWSLPEGWDNCWVHVKGQPGSSFELIEVAQVNGDQTDGS